MPLGTLDGTPPPFFRQGPSALSKLTFFSALALFLMSCAVEMVNMAPVPLVFKGLPVAFIIAGLFALSFLGFSGLKVA